MIASYIACTAAGLVVYYITAKKVKRDEIEMRSAQNVIFPLLIAERDREFLRQLRRNRDEEAELMKNVPGWEVSGLAKYQLLLYSSLACRWAPTTVSQFSRPCPRINWLRPFSRSSMPTLTGNLWLSAPI